MSLCELLCLTSAAVAASYALAIVLRISCFLAGVDIPALGRAWGVATTLAASSLFVGVIIQGSLASGPRFQPILQFLAFVLILLTHLGLSLLAFTKWLGLGAGKAFNLWLIQTMFLLVCFAICGVVGAIVSDL